LFLDYAKAHYTNSREYDEHRYAASPLVRLFGETPVVEFGPKRLRQVRDEMVKSGLCRNVVNRRITRIRTQIKWAVADELVPGSVLEALRAVREIPPNTTAVRESKPREPAHFEDVEPLLPFMPEPAEAIVRLCAQTGARPGELRIMRPMDLDTTDPDCWNYKPGSDAGPHGKHKCAWRHRVGSASHRHPATVDPRQRTRRLPVQPAA